MWMRLSTGRAVSVASRVHWVPHAREAGSAMHDGSGIAAGMLVPGLHPAQAANLHVCWMCGKTSQWMHIRGTSPSRPLPCGSSRLCIGGQRGQTRAH